MQYSNIFPIYASVLSDEYSNTTDNSSDYDRLRAQLREQYQTIALPPDKLTPRLTVAQLLRWLKLYQIDLLRLHIGVVLQLVDVRVPLETTWLQLVGCVCIDLFGTTTAMDAELLQQYKDLLHQYLTAGGFRHIPTPTTILAYARHDR